LLIVALAVFYFRPFIRNGKYMPEILITLLGISFLPASLDTTAIFSWSLYFAAVLALFIGLKNLYFINRTRIEFWSRLLLIGAFNCLYFLGIGSYSFSAIVFFVLTLIIFKNFMPALNDRPFVVLAGSLLALSMIQINWAISLSFLDVFEKIAFSSSVLVFLSIMIWRYIDGDFKIRSLFPNRLIAWTK